MELIVVIAIAACILGICYMMGRKFDKRFGGEGCGSGENIETGCAEAACECSGELPPEAEEPPQEDGAMEAAAPAQGEEPEALPEEIPEEIKE